LVQAVLAALLPERPEGGGEHDHDRDRVRQPEIPVAEMSEDRDRGHPGFSVSASSLGRKLATSGSAKELYAIDLPPLPGEPKPGPGSERGPGASGSLYVFGEGGGAEDQLKACQAAGSLICFRASNIVVVLDEESSPLAAQRLSVAINRLAK
jgi:hypothetical protein